jgi:hypothetical protein
MVFPTRGLKEVMEANFELRNISEGGASVFVGNIATPDFFYLQLGRSEADLVGCYAIHRTADTVSCEFTSPLETKKLDSFIETGAMMRDTLDALFDASSGSERDALLAQANKLFS